MKRFLCLVVPLFCGLWMIVGAGAEDGPKPGVRLLVPAYFYPAGEGLKEWDAMFASPARSRIVAIVNPASGPGETADPNYVEVVKRARRAGVTLIGYVTMSYGKRPIAEVKADVDRWLRLYPGIRGIFFDEQTSDDGHVDYQGAIYDFVRKEKRLDLVVTNPGTVCAERYLARPAADAVCLFEGPLAADSFRFAAWTAKYPPGRIAALAYNVASAESMRRCLRAAVAQGIGYLYITDAGGAMPWDRLPRYWDDEGRAVMADVSPKARR